MGMAKGRARGYSWLRLGLGLRVWPKVGLGATAG